MDTASLEKRIAWIDEQRLKDSETLSRLNDQMNTQHKQLEQCEKLIKEQASEITHLRALTAKINEFDESLSKHRQQVSRQLSDAEVVRTNKENSREELRKGDLKETVKSIDEVKKSLSILGKIQESLDTRKEEEIRITRKADTLAKQIEDIANREQDRIRGLASIDEAIKQESKRVTDLQSDTTEIRKRVDTLRGTMETSQDRIRQVENTVAEMSSRSNEQKEAQVLWMEQQAMRLADFDREWRNWSQRFEKFETLAADLDDRMNSYEETYRNLKLVQTDLDDVIERLERRIMEVSELQRLAEDRFRQEWASFQADDQKRWNSFKLTTDERWKEHDRLHEKIKADFRILEEGLNEISEVFLEFRQAYQERVLEVAAVLQEWAKQEQDYSGK